MLKNLGADRALSYVWEQCSAHDYAPGPCRTRTSPPWHV